MTYKLTIPLEEHKDDVKAKYVKIEKKKTYNVTRETRDNEDAFNNNSEEVRFPNSADGSKIIHEDDRERVKAIEK